MMTDPDVDTKWDGKSPLFVFDGECVLCSGGARWLMRFDAQERVKITPAQSALGQHLYARFGQEFDSTYLLVVGEEAFTKSDGYFRLCRILGGPWHLFRLAVIVPRPVRDWLYDRIAENRYRWFGKAEFCALLTLDQRRRLL